VLSPRAWLKTLTKTIETKSGTIVCSDGVETSHNSFVTIIDQLLRTANGTLDQENDTGQRIDDKITLQGVSIKCMLELNERHSDVTFRLLLISSGKGNIPTQGTLWQNASANQMLDNINTERYTVMLQKYIRLTASNMGNTPPTLKS